MFACLEYEGLYAGRLWLHNLAATNRPLLAPLRLIFKQQSVVPVLASL
jgi:hypothetical protein